MPPLPERDPAGRASLRHAISTLLEEPGRTRIVRDFVAVAGGALALLLAASQVREALSLPQGMVNAVAALVLVATVGILGYRWSHPPLIEGALLPRWIPRGRAAAAVLALAVGVGCWALYQHARAARAGPVAVLPFVRLDAGGDLEALADELARGITQALTQEQAQRVVPFAKVAEQAVSQDSPFAAGEKVGARHVVYGVIARSGSQVEVRASLLNVQSGHSLRNWCYTRPAEEVKGVEREIASGAAASLRGKAANEHPCPVGTTRDALAYRLYVRGRRLLYSGGQSHEAAIRDFVVARERDPTFALAYAGLARGFQLRAKLGVDPTAQEEALVAAKKAVDLGERDERTWAALGLVYREQGKYQEALGALRKAAALTPSWGDGSGLSNLGLVHLEMGRLDSALIWTDSAARLEKHSAPARMRVGMAWEALGHYGNAERSYREAARIDSANAEAHYRLARLLWMRGRAGSAAAHVERIRALDPGSCYLFNWAMLNGVAADVPDNSRDPACEAPLVALAYAAVDNRDQLEVEMDAAQRAFDAGGQGARPALTLAQLHAVSGDPAAAAGMVETAVARGYRNALELRTLPALRSALVDPAACARIRVQLDTMHTRVARLRQNIPGAGSAGASPVLECA